MSSKLLIFVICAFYSISYSQCEKITPLECGNTGLTGLCEINEVRITPCKEAADKKPCNLKRGKTAGIEIDFTALKPMNSFKGLPYAVLVGNEVPWNGLDDNACNKTQCPIAQGDKQTYKINLGLQRSLPRGRFYVKFKFWDDNNEGCCTSFYLKLV